MWKIRSKTVLDIETGRPLYWCHVCGWVPLAYAEVFTTAQKETAQVPFAGEWECIEWQL